MAEGAVPQPAHQASVHHLMPPDVWVLTLSRYQRDNLLNLLQHIMEGDDRPTNCFDTGDWVGEIRWMLGKKNTSGFGPGVGVSHVIDADDHPNEVRGA